MLPTYQNTINNADAFDGAFEVRDETPSPTITALERDLTGRSAHTTSQIGGDRVVFNVYPALGRASVTLSVVEDCEHTHNTACGTPVHEYTRTPAFRVVVTHPAMGRDTAEIHVCATPDEVLAAVNTVAYG